MADTANITPTAEALKPFGGGPTLRQDDWFGAEPDAPELPPPDPISLGTAGAPDVVPEIPTPVVPEVAAATTPEGDAEIPADETPADEVVPAAATGETIAEEPKKQKGFPWSELKELRASRIKLEQDQAVAVTQATERQRQLDEIRQAQEFQRRQQEEAYRAANPGTPGVDRPFTQQELGKLRVEDPVLHAQVVAEMGMHMVQQQAQQVQLLQMQNLIQSHLESFKRVKPDYEDAVRFLEDREMKRAAAMGMSQQEAIAHVQDRTGLLIQSAMRQGKNIGAVAYAIAEAEGWATPVATPAPVVVEPPKPDAAAQIRANQARAAAERGSLGNVPAQAVTRKSTVTLQQFMQLSPAQIERLEKENNCSIDDLIAG